MSKVYKLNNKLVINIPYDVAEALGVREGDDLDFFPYSGKSFLLAKKTDVAELLTRLKGGQPQQAYQRGQQFSYEAEPAGREPAIDPVELALLKKLDTIRYGERTKEKVEGMLNAEEKQTLLRLLKRKFVTLFKKANESEFKYGIEKGIYNKFLFGKRTYANRQAAPTGRTQPGGAASRMPAGAQPWRPAPAAESSNEYVKMLETKGYVVLRSEAEAASVSAALEESIRQGLVVGTRAFDKKFYIALRDFVGRNAPKLMKSIEKRSMGIEDIARENGIDEDGARAVLHILAENGDVTEVRKDVFGAA